MPPPDFRKLLRQPAGSQSAAQVAVANQVSADPQHLLLEGGVLCRGNRHSGRVRHPAEMAEVVMEALQLIE